MDGWDLALLGIAGFVAVIGLVRLMAQRRSQLVQELRKHTRKEPNRKRAAKLPEAGPAAEESNAA